VPGAAALLNAILPAARAQLNCRFLMSLVGGGVPVVSKRIGPDRPMGASTGTPTSSSMRHSAATASCSPFAFSEWATFRPGFSDRNSVQGGS